MPVRPSPSRGLFAVGVAAVSWGLGGAVAAVLYRTSGLGPVAVSFWRLVIGVALLAAVLHRRPGLPQPRPRGRHRAVLAVTGCGLAVYQTAFYAAIADAGLAVATVVTLGAGPVLIAVGGRFLLGERLGAAATAAVGLALAGLLLLTAEGGGDGPRPAAGLGWAVLSAAGYAAVTLLARRTGGGADPYHSARGGFAVAALCLFPLAVAEGLLPAPYAAPVVTLAWLLFLGAVPTALAYGLFFAGLRHIRATTASVVALVEPVTATVLAVGVLGERLTPSAATGTVILLTAVAALALAERRRLPAADGPCRTE